MNATIATDWPYLHVPQRMPEPGTFPLPKARTAVAKRAAHLHEHWTARHDAIRAVEGELRAAMQRAAELRDELTRAYGDADAEPARIAKLETDVAEASGRAGEPWQERFHGAVRSCKLAGRAYAQHVDEQFAALLAELESEARDSTAAIAQAARGLERAEGTWHDVRRRTLDLVRFADRLDGQDVPTSPGLPMQAADLATITNESVPLPLPYERSLRNSRPDALAGEQVITR